MRRCIQEDCAKAFSGRKLSNICRFCMYEVATYPTGHPRKSKHCTSNGTSYSQKVVVLAEVLSTSLLCLKWLIIEELQGPQRNFRRSSLSQNITIADRMPFQLSDMLSQRQSTGQTNTLQSICNCFKNNASGHAVIYYA